MVIAAELRLSPTISPINLLRWLAIYYVSCVCCFHCVLFVLSASTISSNAKKQMQLVPAIEASFGCMHTFTFGITNMKIFFCAILITQHPIGHKALIHESTFVSYVNLVCGRWEIEMPLAWVMPEGGLFDIGEVSHASRML
jgi:hypothetical protein